MGWMNLFLGDISLSDMGLVQMSVSGAVMILAIIVVRALAINKLPKKVFVLLWDVVLLRLLIPFSIPSVFSAYTFVKRSEPLSEAITEVPATGMITQVAGNPVNTGVNAGMSAEIVTQNPAAGISPMVIVWIIGCLLCAAYFAVSYLRCHLEFQTSLPLRNEFTLKWLRCHRLKRTIQIRQSDRISAPLTYGIIKPVILMPKKTDWENRQQLEYVLLHEYTHICRFDTVTKLIATFALCIHWFNPFVWAMYILFNRDLELSCDESVVRQFGEKSKSVYARTLISMEEKKSGLTPLYNSFSRNAIEERITAIMKTRKITIGILIVSVLVIVAIVVPFATSAKDSDETKLPTDETVTEQELTEMESGEIEIGIVSEAVVVTGTPLEMAKEVVSEQFTQMQNFGYVNWRIDGLTEKYVYGPNEEKGLGDMRVSVYQLEYAFLAENIDEIAIPENMIMDEDGWAGPEYPNTYLCMVADGGALSYVVLTENDCVPGDDIFTEELELLLGVGPKTAEDYYAMVTSESAEKVEQFAAGIKEDVLFKDWESLSEKLSYPIQIGGKAVQNSREFLEMDIDGMLNQDFVNAIAAETCREMFFNYQGIMMGATGQVWFASVDNGAGQWELKVIALNGLIKETSLGSEMIFAIGRLYQTTGVDVSKRVTEELNISEFDSPYVGVIQSTVAENEIPTIELQSNFGCEGAEVILYGSGIAVYLDGTWIAFEQVDGVIASEPAEELSETWLKAFAAAYFAADTEQIQKFLAASFEGEPEGYTGDREDVLIHACKGLSQTADAEVGETCEVSVEFKVSEDADYYTYLTVTVVKETDGWKVQDYRLEL